MIPITTRASDPLELPEITSPPRPCATYLCIYDRYTVTVCGRVHSFSEGSAWGWKYFQSATVKIPAVMVASPILLYAGRRFLPQRWP